MDGVRHIGADKKRLADGDLEEFAAGVCLCLEGPGNARKSVPEDKRCRPLRTLRPNFLMVIPVCKQTMRLTIEVD